MEPMVTISLKEYNELIALKNIDPNALVCRLASELFNMQRGHTVSMMDEPVLNRDVLVRLKEKGILIELSSNLHLRPGNIRPEDVRFQFKTT